MLLALLDPLTITMPDSGLGKDHRLGELATPNAVRWVEQRVARMQSGIQHLNSSPDSATQHPGYKRPHL